MTNQPPKAAPLCGAYLGDNAGTCPQLTCIRLARHDGLCDNVCGDAAVMVEQPEDGACTWCARPMREHPMESCIGEPEGTQS